MGTLLSIEKLRRRYASGTVALDNVHLKVGRGEFLSVLGPSGCGKSTLLRLIAGLAEPDHGRITWSGDGIRPEIGFVFQDATLMPWARVADNVSLPLRLSGQPRKEASARVREVLQLVGMEEFANSFPRELSGGMRMRVSIARALVTSPTLLLMDEPFAALDEITRNELNDTLVTLWQSIRCTIIFVTHSVFESVYLSSRIAVMSPRPGRIVDEIPINAPYPRGESYRTSVDYVSSCRLVSTRLRKAMERAA